MSSSDRTPGPASGWTLGIDTSAGQCAVALAGPAEHSAVREMTRGHAEALFPMIEEILAEAGIAHAEISRVAVCTGPGSFTGLRVGISAARGLALGLGVPSVGVTRFEALAPKGFTGAISLPTRDGAVLVQDFEEGAPVGDPRRAEGAAENRLPDPLVIARIGALKSPGPRPAPLYMRGPDAALPSVPPPAILD